MKDFAFTLSEVLIALVVIGIIAAITLTTVMPNIQERVNSQRQANIVYKVTQATNLMKANGAMINGFESTDAFVDELQKYLKIMKRCDSDHIVDCWPTKKVRTSEGKEYEVSKAQTRALLGFKTNKETKNVGIILADGATLIMTYDSTNPGLSIGDPLTATNKTLPVGGKYKEFLEYTTNSTAGLAFVMDVNGSKGPNSETLNNKMYDIRSFNSARFEGCAGTKLNGKCYTPIDSIPPLDCSRTSQGTLIKQENAPYCDEKSYWAEDYWAGAMKECSIRGMSMPDKDTLTSLCLNKQKQLGIQSGIFWSTTTFENDSEGKYKYTSSFNSSCNSRYNVPRNIASNKVICIGDL